MIVFFHKNFKKKYKKLSFKIQKKVDDRIFLFRNNLYDPQLNNHILHGILTDCWSINITGNYRALYKFVSENTVEFIDIDTHSNLYK